MSPSSFNNLPNDGLKRASGEVQANCYSFEVLPSLPLGTKKEDFDPNKHSFVIKASDSKGQYAGSVAIEHHDEHIYPHTALVLEGHRRKGVASGMYAKAEEISKKKIVPEYVADGSSTSHSQSEDAKLLWANKKNKFGKAAQDSSNLQHLLQKAVALIKSKIEELEKAEVHGNTIVPTARDLGKPNPQNKDEIGVKYLNGYAWALRPDLASEKDKQLVSVAGMHATKNKYNTSQRNKLKQLVSHVLQDPHRYVRTSDEGDTQGLRARHLISALAGHEDYLIHNDGNQIELHAVRHNKTSNPQVHVWKYENELKFSHAYPISEFKGGAYGKNTVRAYRRDQDRVGSDDARGAGVNVGARGAGGRDSGQVLPKDDQAPKGDRSIKDGKVIIRRKNDG